MVAVEHAVAWRVRAGAGPRVVNCQPVAAPSDLAAWPLAVVRPDAATAADGDGAVDHRFRGHDPDAVPRAVRANERHVRDALATRADLRHRRADLCRADV